MNTLDAELAAVIERLRRLRAEVQRALDTNDRGGFPDTQRERGRQADTRT
ncbi:hypothetical protein EV188_11260 [Actinomycetospora succinea]|uniref:Uncharacterized protein n=1 Tax=Actinomycetospora succinea TaxID=663603 RepID=A0A4R6UL92_9PSEU|nr:hypothetical protein [Actinomycetospora succinea]TDQ47790.1 hypothetical protein EV188_11260 [Actinomycetospora succinea]